LLGGLWILQTFPAVVFGLFTRWFSGPALLAGWAVGFFGGSYVAWTDGLKPLHTIALGGASYTLYVGVLALAANVAVAAVVSAVLGGAKREVAKVA
jgi:SSS family solute:Na+ symporter